MYIEKILLSNFRNLENKEYEFSKNFNLIYGKNAQGKTSLIESVYFLASGKSFRTRKVIEQIKNKETEAIVFGIKDGEKYSIRLNKEKREFYKNGEKIQYKEYLGNILAISFSPEDVELIAGSPDVRRRVFNYEISQVDANYLKLLLDFQKILKIRNKLIKENNMNSEIFLVYTEKFIDLSVELMVIKYRYIKELSKIVNEIYQNLFLGEKSVEIVYNSFMAFIEDKNEMKKFFKNYLLQREEKERIYGYSISGPQKDDFSILLDNKLSKSYASTGEKKSILLAIKLAQGEYIKRKYNKKAIYLFDDISAYFDEFRKYSVLDYLNKENTQCFFTSTEKIDVKNAKYIILDRDI
ncbi:DNA replication/repair protein RecF [Oceanivirga miroungae]|uniref:DNA replication and repair protein RecF n=1 Tax=Oceanivirga miroungae TaxID=1130046 RepID=A0A6I8M5Y9_9FUSO|nr:DNA replication and repair protein RecF [Oceanivirga miroungae]VWL84822.1 DNA replication and repair protein RecF [Oceanivirga miroungae]